MNSPPKHPFDNNIPLTDSDNQSKQIVYMVAQENYADDDIDLFELLLPPLKYKLQILTILVLGILIAIGVVWFNYNIGIGNSIEDKILDIETELADVIQKKDFAISDLIQAIESIPDTGSVYRISGAIYQYSDKSNPEKIRRIKADTFQESIFVLNAEEEEEEEEKAKAIAGKDSEKRDYDVILTIKKDSIDNIKNQLVRIYKSLIDENNAIEELQLQSKQKQLNLFVLLKTKKDFSRSTIDQETKSIDSQIRTIRENIQSLSTQLSELLPKQAFLLGTLGELHKTLEENVQLAEAQDEIPLEIWNEIKSKQQPNLEDIKTIASSIIKFTSLEYQFKLLHFIFENQLKIPIDEFSWPAFDYLKEDPPQKKPKLTINNISILKAIVVGLIFALFIGVTSTYIRTYKNQMNENKALKSKFQSLTEALKYWKF